MHIYHRIEYFVRYCPVARDSLTETQNRSLSPVEPLVGPLYSQEEYRKCIRDDSNVVIVRVMNVNDTYSGLSETVCHRCC